MKTIRTSVLFSLALAFCVGCAPSDSSKSSDSGKPAAPAMRMATLQNKAGKYVEPSIASGQAALAGAKLPEDLIAWLPDPDGDTSYPIVTYTWVICYKKYAEKDASKVAALKDALTYCLTEGQKISESLGYIPLPDEVVAKDKAALNNIQGAGTPAGKDSVMLHGAGASFPAPLYGKWFKAYNTAHPEVQIDYQSVGSGTGVKNVIDKTVDFGASDAAMSSEEIAKVDTGVQLLPMTAGSIVLAYNLPEVENLRLSRDAYAGIFLGKITKWNDKAIADCNPGVTLPDTEIKVVVRSDGSGTTFVFTKHVSAISDEFAKVVGTSKQPNWPVGSKMKGNEGIAAAIKQTPGAIGYLEFGYVKSEQKK